MNHAETLAGMLLANRHVVVLTGAGISTDSGIPDFRTPGSGLWEQYDPMEVLSLEALCFRPRKFYTIGLKILTGSFDASPNRAHEILGRLERAGLVHAIITQNIDGLHQAAGSEKVLEVHGHLRTCRCTRCHRQVPMQEVVGMVDRGEIPPRCDCGGIMRPDVVLFGDPMPPVLDQAIQESRRADLMLVLGSSLTVSPVCNLPGLARRIAIINREPTPMDPLADFTWRVGISEALTKLEQSLLAQGALS